MAAIGSRAGARLRKTFHYPEDSDDSASDRLELDEQEQESVIRTLAAENAARNASFHRILCALPLLSTSAYIAPLLRGTLVPSSLLLAVTSLLATWFLVHRLPAAVTGFALLDARARARTTAPRKRGILPPPQHHLSSRAPLSYSADSPLERFLPLLNVALAALAALAGWLNRGSASHPVWWLDGVLALLPLGILGVVVAVKMAMAAVDPEAELSALKYDYKGA